jgi:hypothetical protein
MSCDSSEKLNRGLSSEIESTIPELDIPMILIPSVALISSDLMLAFVVFVVVLSVSKSESRFFLGQVVLPKILSRCPTDLQ